MISSSDIIIGEVLEALPGAKFKVKFVNLEKEITCYLSGRMHKNRISVIIGDR